MSVHEAESLSLNERVIGVGIFPEIPLLAQAQVLYERDGGLYECYIPAELIDHEEVPVKEEWAKSLARQMRQESSDNGGSGQQTPIRLGWIEGEAKFRIIDGFHRDAALIENGETAIYATVKRTDWDTLYDDRIFAAKDHTHVRFSRVVKWIHETWNHSGMSDDLSIEQAILLYRYETDGSRLGIDSDIAQRAKAWVANKERLWDMPAMTIHSYLQTAESVDPVLVNATRDRKGGHELIAPTQQIIKIFSNLLPNEFALQNLAWQLTKEYKLKGPQVNALCSHIKGMEVAEAKETLAEIDIANIEPVHSESQDRHLRRAADPRHKGATALQAAKVEIERVNKRVQQSLDRNEEVNPAMLKNLNETVHQARELQTQLGILASKLAALKERGQAKNSTVIPIDQRLVERAFIRHKTETAENHYRTPKTRLRISQLAMDLPAFGRFTHEDWGSLEPHHRLAIALDHPEITDQTFNSTAELIRRALELSLLPEEAGLNNNSIQHMTKLLTANAPREVGPIITHDTSKARIVLSESGRTYLAEVVKNALLAVDGIQSNQESAQAL